MRQPLTLIVTIGQCVACISLFLVNLSHGVNPPYSSTAEKAEAYSLPALPYGYQDLEPWIDRGTVQAHYEGHHENYRRKMNALLDQWRDQVAYWGVSDFLVKWLNLVIILHNYE